MRENLIICVLTFPLHVIILFQLLGLKACHDRNITHRDIKPGKELLMLMIAHIVYNL